MNSLRRKIKSSRRRYSSSKIRWRAIKKDLINSNKKEKAIITDKANKIQDPMNKKYLSLRFKLLIESK